MIFSRRLYKTSGKLRRTKTAQYRAVTFSASFKILTPMLLENVACGFSSQTRYFALAKSAPYCISGTQ